MTSLETGIWNARYVEAPWPVLLLCPRDAWWYVSITRLAPGQPLGWKVDAVRPVRRTGDGYDSMDLMLDIFAEPNLNCWTLKDEDELELAEQCAILDEDEVHHARAGMDEAAGRLDARSAPFDLAWLDWIPEPTYPTPVLPEDLLNGQPR